jgi:(p)ppGpp synthase/HD superfamily hydrolase
MPSIWNQEKYINALRYAARLHQDQKVPGSDLPYIVHVAMVAMEVSAALALEDGLNGDLAVQCALLHDVMEDAGSSRREIQENFGEAVADGVFALTKLTDLETRDDKFQDSLIRIKQQPREIWLVKMADRITNLQPPPGHWTKMKKTRYHQEAQQVLEALQDASAFLAQRLKNKIEEYRFYFQ